MRKRLTAYFVVFLLHISHSYFYASADDMDYDGDIDNFAEAIEYENKSPKLSANEVFVEADVIKGGNDTWDARGNVILKKKEGLINADEVQTFRQKQITNSNTSNNNKQNEFSKKMIINAKDNIKIRTNKDDFIFAKSMFYDERTSTGLFKNTQIFPYQKNGRSNVNIYTTQFEKKENIFTLKDAIVSPCNIFDDKNIAGMRKRCFLEMTEDDEIISTPKNNDTTLDSNEEMKNSLKKDFVTIGSNQIIFDQTKKLLTFNEMTIRLLRVPILYLPRYSIHTDGRGDTGFLMPSYMFRGTKQIGIEIPFYWKIKDNMDLTISRLQYIDTYKFLGKNNVNLNNSNEKLNLKDRFMLRESSTNLRFRHTIDEKNRERSFYNLELLLTDPTALMNEDNGLAKIDSNGNIKKGIRWLFHVNSKMKLSKTTFLQADWMQGSDRDMPYLYRFVFYTTKTNHVKLFDVDKNRFLFAGLYHYQSIFTNLDRRTTPLVYPVIRAEYDFKKDKFGGNFYVKSRSFYVNRLDGISNLGLAVDGGYKLVHIFDIGTKLTFDTMERVQYNHLWFNGNVGNPIDPLLPAPNNWQFFYGNYARFASFNHYGARDLAQLLSFNKLQAEHPFVLKSVLGTTIINPKVALKYVPHLGRNYFLMDDNIGASYSYLNAFELTQTSGLGMYDTGASAIYGAEIFQKFNKHVEWGGQIAHATRLYKQKGSWFLTEPTGFVNSMSDLMAQSEIKLTFNRHIIKLSAYTSFDTQRNTLRYLGAQLSYSFIKRFTFSIDYNNFDKTATYFGQGASLVSLHMYWKVFRDLEIFGGIRYNLQTIHTRTFDIGQKLSYYRVGFKYMIGCLQLGITVYENLMRAPGIPGHKMIIFTFNITGIG